MCDEFYNYLDTIICKIDSMQIHMKRRKLIAFNKRILIDQLYGRRISNEKS